jgi:hypothetical protein
LSLPRLSLPRRATAAFTRRLTFTSTLNRTFTRTAGLTARPGARIVSTTRTVSRPARNGILARHPHLRRDYAVRRRFSDHASRRNRWRAIGTLRLGDGATAGDQAARPPPQAATRTFFTVGGFVVACAFACIGLAMCFIGTNGALGFGRIAVVGMCQNNLNCVGSRARRRRVKKSGRW